MKQAYEAPKLEVVQYSLHEAIAANCSNKVYNHSSNGGCTPTEFGKDILDMGVNFAGDKEKSCSIPLDDYCYFTQGNSLFNS